MFNFILENKTGEMDGNVLKSTWLSNLLALVPFHWLTCLTNGSHVYVYRKGSNGQLEQDGRREGHNVNNHVTTEHTCTSTGAVYKKCCMSWM